MTRLRKTVLTILLAVLFILVSALCGCGDSVPSGAGVKVYKGFSVHCLDVGQGDSIFIRLPDRKNMLIDCGENDVHGKNFNTIKDHLNAYSVKTIDYFVLTHPDGDHIGNAQKVLNEFSVKQIYIPIVDDSVIINFPEYKSVLEIIESKGIKTEYSDSYKYIVGEDYGIAFLSPLPLAFEGSSYAELNAQTVVSDSAVNNLSPIIYAKISGVRFLFTGDAEKSQEDLVLSNYSVGTYQTYFSKKGIDVNLESIDFLKVSHHGANDATKQEILNVLKPKSAVISVGGNNYYGHPTSAVLLRLEEINPEYKLYRTDVHGTVSVYKNSNGQIKVD